MSDVVSAALLGRLNPQASRIHVRCHLQCSPMFFKGSPHNGGWQLDALVISFGQSRCQHVTKILDLESRVTLAYV